MTTFVLVPGAGGAGEVYWREVVVGLQRYGHTAVPVEIAGDDEAVGLPEYAALTDAAIGDQRDVVLVAQSLGGFTAPMVTRRDQLARIVLVNAMVPLPGETPGEWGEHVGQAEAFAAAAAADGRPNTFDLDTVFLHDIPAEVRAAMADGDREPAPAPFGQPCTFETWPDVPVHVLVGADDRLFPLDLQVRVARDRLGVEADLIPGGHLVAKSRPDVVVDRLLAYAAGVPFSLAAAGAQLRRIARGVPEGRLDDRTPCEDWSVRDLVGHVGMLVPAFAAAARQEPGTPPPVPGPLPADWRDRLDRDLDDLITAWLQPPAWSGTSEAGGVAMPAADLAVVVLDELVLHTWDLARATGQPCTPDDRDVALCTEFAAAMSTPETADSRAGLYGPAVLVGGDAGAFDRLLGLAGRDPLLAVIPEDRSFLAVVHSVGCTGCVWRPQALPPERWRCSPATCGSWHDRGMTRARLSTTVDAVLLDQARSVRAGVTDAVLVDEALAALLARHRAADIDASYAAYDQHPLDEPDEWGDLASFRRAAAAS